MFYEIILFNFLFFCATKLQFLFQLSLKFAHLEVEIIVAQAKIVARAIISENTVDRQNTNSLVKYQYIGIRRAKRCEHASDRKEVE